MYNSTINKQQADNMRDSALVCSFRHALLWMHLDMKFASKEEEQAFIAKMRHRVHLAEKEADRYVERYASHFYPIISAKTPAQVVAEWRKQKEENAKKT
jgi:hypothetical protein